MTFEELNQIADFDEIHTNSLMKMTPMEKPDSLSTDDITVHKVYIGLQPESSQYGDMLGIIEYKHEFYRFRFHIHRPKQGSPHLSNKMTGLDGIEVVTEHNIRFINYSKKAFGCEAFWEHTPLEYLKKFNDGAYELRLFMQNVIAYSRREKLCQKLRRTDREYLKHRHGN